MRTRRTTEGIRSQKKVLVVWAESLLLRLAPMLRAPPPDPPGASPLRARARPDCVVVEDMAAGLLLHGGLKPGLKGLQCRLGVGLAREDGLRQLVQCLAAVEDREVGAERAALGREGLSDGLVFLDDL